LSLHRNVLCNLVGKSEGEMGVRRIMCRMDFDNKVPLGEGALGVSVELFASK
jgi:hypothetical protein